MHDYKRRVNGLRDAVIEAVVDYEIAERVQVEDVAISPRFMREWAASDSYIGQVSVDIDSHVYKVGHSPGMPLRMGIVFGFSLYLLDCVPDNEIWVFTRAMWLASTRNLLSFETLSLSIGQDVRTPVGHVSST